MTPATIWNRVSPYISHVFAKESTMNISIQRFAQLAFLATQIFTILAVYAIT